MKRPIEWHEDCLKNTKHTLVGIETIAIRAREDADRLRVKVKILEAQIAEARRRSIRAFDADRLLQKRGGR